MNSNKNGGLKFDVEERERKNLGMISETIPSWPSPNSPLDKINKNICLPTPSLRSPRLDSVSTLLLYYSIRSHHSGCLKMLTQEVVLTG